MTRQKDLRLIVGDIETPQPTVADSFGDESGGEPQTVRLGDLWRDFVRVAIQERDPGAAMGSSSVVRLLDDMKGILQWD
jgi:hypothetical protein